MRALIRRLQTDVAGRPDRLALGVLAGQLEEQVARLHTSVTIAHEIETLRNINGIMSRLCREYARLGINLPFEQ